MRRLTRNRMLDICQVAVLALALGTLGYFQLVHLNRPLSALAMTIMLANACVFLVREAKS